MKELRNIDIAVYFYGDKSHIFHYLYPNSSFDIQSFFQPVDGPDYLQEIKNALQKQSKVVFFVINSYPEISQLTTISIKRYLMNNGFDEVQEDSIKYYIRNGNE